MGISVTQAQELAVQYKAEQEASNRKAFLVNCLPIIEEFADSIIKNRLRNLNTAFDPKMFIASVDLQEAFERSGYTAEFSAKLLEDRAGVCFQRLQEKYPGWNIQLITSPTNSTNPKYHHNEYGLRFTPANTQPTTSPPRHQ